MAYALIVCIAKYFSKYFLTFILKTDFVTQQCIMLSQRIAVIGMYSLVSPYIIIAMTVLFISLYEIYQKEEKTK